MRSGSVSNGIAQPALGRFLRAPAGTLWLGFAGLLLLMGVMAVDSMLSVRDAEVASAAFRAEARWRDGLLDQLRTDIYRSSTVMRDHLLEMDDERAASQKAEMLHLRARINDTLSVYSREIPASEGGVVRKLSERFQIYWQSMAPALSWDASTRRTEGGAFLKRVVIPLRTELVELTREITILNERNLDAADARVAGVQSRFRLRVAVISAISLVLGLLLGAFTVRRVRHLEEVARARFLDVEDARRELQKLSARLVNAQEEERRRLARELHDEVGQSMSAVLVELGRVETAQDSGARAERLTSARHMAEESVGMVRNMALLLRPSMLDDLGLVAALKWQAREVMRRHGLKVKMVTEDIDENLPDSHRTCVYRVVQEALSNCARHAQASQVRVVVHQNQDGLSVSVQDDGVGFEPQQEKGLGLLGMEERVSQLDGIFTVESKPGQGTVLSIQLPLKGGAAPETGDEP